MEIKINFPKNLILKLEKLSKSLRIEMDDLITEILNEKLNMISQSPEMLFNYMKPNPISVLE